jgi:hypothetical protein
MEERFVQAGVELASELREKNPDHQFREDLAEYMAKVQWRWFLADMSDDYFGRTLPEQRAIRDEVHKELGEIDYPYHLR